jgi:SSS family solute:Na+ symporter
MIGGFAMSIFLKFLPNWTDLSSLYDLGMAVPNAEGVYEIPFLDRMGIVFAVCVVGMIIISLVAPAKKQVVVGSTLVTSNESKGLEVDASMFKPSTAFTVIALLICGILTALYTIFW